MDPLRPLRRNVAFGGAGQESRPGPAMGLDEILAESRRLLAQQPGQTNAGAFSAMNDGAHSGIRRQLEATNVDVVSTFIAELRPEGPTERTSTLGDVDMEGFVRRVHASIAYTTCEDARATSLAMSVGSTGAVGAVLWEQRKAELNQTLGLGRQVGTTTIASGQQGVSGSSLLPVPSTSTVGPGPRREGAGTGRAGPYAPATAPPSSPSPRLLPVNAEYASSFLQCVSTVAGDCIPAPGPVTLMGGVAQAGHEKDDPTAAVGHDGEISMRTRHWRLLAGLTGELGVEAGGRQPIAAAFSGAWGAIPTSVSVQAADSPPQTQVALVEAFLKTLHATSVQPWWKAALLADGRADVSVPVFPLIYNLLRAGAWVDAMSVAHAWAGAVPDGRTKNSALMIATALNGFVGVIAAGEGVGPYAPVSGASSSLNLSASMASGLGASALQQSGPSARISAMQRVQGADLLAAVQQCARDWAEERDAIASCGATGVDPWSGPAPHDPFRATLLCLLSGSGGDTSLPTTHPLPALMQGHPHDWIWHRLWFVVTADLSAALESNVQASMAGAGGGWGAGTLRVSLAGSALRMSALGPGASQDISMHGMRRDLVGRSVRYSLSNVSAEAWEVAMQGGNGRGWGWAADPRVYRTAEALLLVGLPEAAVAHLAAAGGQDCGDKHVADAAHLAIGLAYYGLLRTFPSRLALAQAPGARPPGTVKELPGMSGLLWSVSLSSSAPIPAPCDTFPIQSLDIHTLLSGYMDTLRMGPELRMDYMAMIPDETLREAVMAQVIADALVSSRFPASSEPPVTARALARRVRGLCAPGAAGRPVAQALQERARRVLAAAGDAALEQGDVTAAADLYLQGSDVPRAIATVVPALVALAAVPYEARQGGGGGGQERLTDALSMRSHLLGLGLLAAESEADPHNIEDPSTRESLSLAQSLCAFYDRMGTGDTAGALAAAYGSVLLPQPSTPSGLGSAIGSALSGLLGTARPAGTVSQEEWSRTFNRLPAALREAYAPFMVAVATAILVEVRAAKGRGQAQSGVVADLRARMASLHTQIPPHMMQYMLLTSATTGQGSAIDVIAGKAATL